MPTSSRGHAMSSTALDRFVQQLRRMAESQRVESASDAELLNRFQASGDRQAFAAIVRRHGAAVLAGCRKILSSEADVEDAFQATFLVLLRNGRAIRRRQSLGSWLSGVAHRVALKALARTERR